MDYSLIGVKTVETAIDAAYGAVVLRNIVDDLIIACCGIGAQGPEPGSVIKAGAGFEIIGRAIYEADNSKSTITQIVEEMGIKNWHITF